MSDDPTLHKRLARMERLNSKVEDGEELTDAEVEQYIADARAVKETLEDALEPMADAVAGLVSDTVEAIQPLAELAAEYEEAGDG